MIFAEVQPEIIFRFAVQLIVRESYKEPVYICETNAMEPLWVGGSQLYRIVF